MRWHVPATVSAADDVTDARRLGISGVGLTRAAGTAKQRCAGGGAGSSGPREVKPAADHHVGAGARPSTRLAGAVDAGDAARRLRAARDTPVASLAADDPDRYLDTENSLIREELAEALPAPHRNHETTSTSNGPSRSLLSIRHRCSCLLHLASCRGAHWDTKAVVALACLSVKSTARAGATAGHPPDWPISWRAEAGRFLSASTSC